MAECYGWKDLLNFQGSAGNFYPGQCDYFGGTTVLPQVIGWVIVVAFGAVFTAFTSVALWLDSRVSSQAGGSEAFTTAGRAVKAGLTACDIVSKWTWAATLLQSSNVAYKYGVSGPFWYAAGATIQVLLFAIMAVEIKRKAPTCHTVLEVVRARWGTVAHLTFLVFCLLTNIIVTSMLILGGAAVVNGLTGMNIYAAAFLLPVGVMAYTAQGGLKASYVASWANTGAILIALVVFGMMTYASGKRPVGSINAVWENLQVISAFKPVANNKEGSYLTMWSVNGLVFGIINVIGNFGTVFVDQSYWQGAIGAKPSATYKGYLLGGLCWFAVPFTMATSMGLAARAMNLPVTIAESNAGLVPAAVAQELMGAGGGFLLMLQLWMAVTATANSEQLAVASLIAYDVYRTYVNPKATGKQMVFVSRVMVCVYAVLSGILAIVLMKIGLSLGWVYLFMGIMIGSAVMPIAFSITWKNCSAAGAVTGAIGGLIGAIITWIAVAKSMTGVLTIDSLGGDFPMLAGNVVAIGFSGLLCVVISLLKPQNYDWALMKEIPTIEDDSNAMMEDTDTAALNRAIKWTWLTGGVLTLVLVVAWPLLALPAGVFSKAYFTMWIVIALTWGFAAMCVCLFMPWWESRRHIKKIFKGVISGSVFRARPAQAQMASPMTKG
uniref:Urea active transporter n=1 Tax=Tetradesmus obliquus TaxID=3088 RepID=A0A383W3Q7_TETOB|eukprot:jgi/Sobl393_1/15290/SZX71769.1